MRAYSMDLRERTLLDSDAGMTAADVAAKYRVSGSWVRLFGKLTVSMIPLPIGVALRHGGCRWAMA